MTATHSENASAMGMHVCTGGRTSKHNASGPSTVWARMHARTHARTHTHTHTHTRDCLTAVDKGLPR